MGVPGVHVHLIFVLGLAPQKTEISSSPIGSRALFDLILHHLQDTAALVGAGVLDGGMAARIAITAEQAGELQRAVAKVPLRPGFGEKWDLGEFFVIFRTEVVETLLSLGPATSG